MENKRNSRLSWFFKWFIDNKVVTALLILLLLTLNVFLLYKINFIFKPIISFLGVLALPIIIAAVFYYLLNPIVDFFEKRKVPRTVTILLLFALIIGLVIWGLGLAIPAIIAWSRNFIHHFPDYMRYAQNVSNNFVDHYNLTNLNINIDTLIQRVGNQALDMVQNFYSTVVHGFGGFISSATGLILDIIIFPFILFYLLRDGKGLGPYFTEFLPPKWQPDANAVLASINGQLSSFIRGEIIVAFAAFVMLAIGLSIIGLPYAFTIAIVAGAFNLIPYLGSFLAFGIALIVAILTDPLMILKVIIVFVIEQTIEGRFISPLVLGSQLEIHPITILFILLTAGSVFGIWGLFLGIPVYAIIKIIVSYIYNWYRDNSELFQTGFERLE